MGDMASPTPPHLAEPVLSYVTDEGYQAWSEAIARGFQEPFHQDMADAERSMLELDRSYGFQVGERWVATFGALTRRIQVPGGADVANAAITVVTVHPPYRRRGLLTAMMRHQLEDCQRRGEPLATLWASESLIYGRYGFGPAVTRHVLKAGTRSLQFLPGIETSGSVDELTREDYEAVARRLHPRLREGIPGTMVRNEGSGWEFALIDLEHVRGGASERRHVVHYDDAGEPDGLASYRFKEDYASWEPASEVRVREVWAADPVVYASLWRYLLDLDLARHLKHDNAAPDEPLRLMVTDHRAVRQELEDALYVRVIDVAAALRARAYAAPVDVVLEVDDPLLEANAGRWRLTSKGEASSTTVERTDADPDLSLGILELGTAYLGGTSLADLHRARRVVEHTSGAVAEAATALSWTRAPWCPDFF